MHRSALARIPFALSTVVEAGAHVHSPISGWQSGTIARRAIRNPCCLNNPVSEPTLLAMGLRQNRSGGLAAFHVSALHRRGKSRSMTAFVMRSEPQSSS